jgi:hypothetical protein
MNGANPTAPLVGSGVSQISDIFTGTGLAVVDQGLRSLVKGDPGYPHSVYTHAWQTQMNLFWKVRVVAANGLAFAFTFSPIDSDMREREREESRECSVKNKISHHNHSSYVPMVAQRPRGTGQAKLSIPCRK